MLGVPLSMLLMAMWLTPASAGDIGYKSPAEALADLKAKPGVTAREENDWIVLHDSANNTIWSITSDAHPAHPTALERAIVAREGQVLVEMNVLCGASREICDQVVAQFQQINQGLRDGLQN